MSEEDGKHGEDPVCSGEITKHCGEKMCMLKNAGQMHREVCHMQWEVNRAGGKIAQEVSGSPWEKWRRTWEGPSHYEDPP